MSNQTGGNEVLVYDRAADGSLTPAGTVATGGTGTGGGLGNQGAVTLTDDGRWLLVVNAGSNDVSVFAVRPNGLQLTDRVSSGGMRPISVTTHGNLVYVLNAGGDGNIAGFSFGNDGSLTSLAGSSRPLSAAGVAPAQIGFDRGGDVLAVTEKASNMITTYLIGPNGLPSAPIANASAGQTPFGFSFDHRGRMVVSEAFGGAVDASTSSLYEVGRDGILRVLDGAVPTTETAACWIIISQDGRFAYATNGGSGSVSGFQIGSQGDLTLLDSDGRTGVAGPGTTPLDGAISRGGRYLYVLLAGTSEVGVFEVGADGGLTLSSTVAGLPAGANGMAAS
jgi:6-phosphogluconolactonase (cycloisomerase 2 family)